MRFLHDEKDLQALWTFLAELDAPIKRFSRRAPGRPGEPVSLASVIQDQAFWDRPENGGAEPSHFIWIAPPENQDMILAEAATFVEKAGDRGILLVVYPDGGLISITGTTMPFQLLAVDASHWWTAQ